MREKCNAVVLNENELIPSVMLLCGFKTRGEQGGAYDIAMLYIRMYEPTWPTSIWFTNIYIKKTPHARSPVALGVQR